MSTTLSLYWNLPSASREDRFDATVKLIGALENFQERHLSETAVDASASGLDAFNAPDVAYAVKRLVRGLSSPREFSRLGFAAALTEVRQLNMLRICVLITGLPVAV